MISRLALILKRHKKAIIVCQVRSISAFNIQFFVVEKGNGLQSILPNEEFEEDVFISLTIES
jgi:hypothetical protein